MSLMSGLGAMLCLLFPKETGTLLPVLSVNPSILSVPATAFKYKSTPAGSYDKSRLIGFFANLNYGYDNRYFLDLSYRTDGQVSLDVIPVLLRSGRQVLPGTFIKSIL